MADIDWESINEKLPYQRNPEEKAKRRELFNQFDPNGNGYLSLAEVSAFQFLVILLLFVCLSGRLPQRKESGYPIRDFASIFWLI